MEWREGPHPSTGREFALLQQPSGSLFSRRGPHGSGRGHTLGSPHFNLSLKIGLGVTNVLLGLPECHKLCRNVGSKEVLCSCLWLLRDTWSATVRSGMLDSTESWASSSRCVRDECSCTSPAVYVHLASNDVVLQGNPARYFFKSGEHFHKWVFVSGCTFLNRKLLGWQKDWVPIGGAFCSLAELHSAFFLCRGLSFQLSLGGELATSSVAHMLIVCG